jgi:hypothetical protein
MKVWTLEITGGNPFCIEVPHHPLLEHDGGKSVWHTNLDITQVAAIRDVAIQNGATLNAFAETDAAKVKEMELAQKMQTEGWKTAQCPLCYFCDMTVPGRCGRFGWHPQVLASAMKHPKAIESLAHCPLKSGT